MGAAICMLQSGSHGGFSRLRTARAAITLTLLLAAQRARPANATGNQLRRRLRRSAAAPPAAPPPIDFSKVEIKTTDLGDDVYMLEGQGGNITVAVAKDGIIMVDGEYAPLHDKIKAAIATISNLPIKYLVNTHYHGDHTGGNAAVRQGRRHHRRRGQRQEPARRRHHQRPDRRQDAAGGGRRAADRRPTPALLKIRLPGRVADLKHIANAHTDGDTYVWFKTANVLSTGDTFTIGRYPNIDFANGGNIKGMIAAADTYLKLTNDKTRIVPGHGPLADKAALIGYRTMLVTARDRMAKLVKDGKSEDDVIAAKPFADLDTKWAPTDREPRISSAWSITRWPTSPRRSGRCSSAAAHGAETSMKELVAIAEQIAARLIERRQTIAVAESSTGGLISASLLAVPGASAYFLGGARGLHPRRAADPDGHPDEAMKGIRSASEPYAKLLAGQIASALPPTGACRKPARRGPPATAMATPPAIAAWRSPGRGESVITLETGSADRRQHACIRDDGAEAAAEEFGVTSPSPRCCGERVGVRGPSAGADANR